MLVIARALVVKRLRHRHIVRPQGGWLFRGALLSTVCPGGETVRAHVADNGELVVARFQSLDDLLLAS